MEVFTFLCPLFLMIETTCRGRGRGETTVGEIEMDSLLRFNLKGEIDSILSSIILSIRTSRHLSKGRKRVDMGEGKEEVRME